MSNNQNNSNRATPLFLNKLLALLFCAVILVTAASAQNKILADGNPPLTDAMVERYSDLFEWSLDVSFSAQDRAAIEKEFVKYWQTGDENNVKAVLGALDFAKKLDGAGDAKKRELQPQIKQKIIEAMESDRSDTLNALLLGIYQRNQKANAVAENGGASLSALVGTWRVLHGNSIVSVEKPSGRIGDGNSMIAEYDIKPDGRVAFTFILQQSNYGCTTRIKTYKTGRAAVSGSRVTFAYEAGGTTQSEDNCNQKYNYTKKLAAEKETFDFQLKSENGKPQFCFASSKLKDCAIKIK